MSEERERSNLGVPTADPASEREAYQDREGPVAVVQQFLNRHVNAGSRHGRKGFQLQKKASEQRHQERDDGGDGRRDAVHPCKIAFDEVAGRSFVVEPIIEFFHLLLQPPKAKGPATSIRRRTGTSVVVGHRIEGIQDSQRRRAENTSARYCATPGVSSCPSAEVE